jgi:hypothetical protein
MDRQTEEGIKKSFNFVGRQASPLSCKNKIKYFDIVSVILMKIIFCNKKNQSPSLLGLDLFNNEEFLLTKSSLRIDLEKIIFMH